MLIAIVEAISRIIAQSRRSEMHRDGAIALSLLYFLIIQKPVMTYFVTAFPVDTTFPLDV